jgi:hypothetical protein
MVRDSAAPDARAIKSVLQLKSEKTFSPNHRLVIALHSPGGFVETGLLYCPPEKQIELE